MVISGQVGRNVMGTLAFQECPAVDITKPVTKFSYCLESVEEVPYIMDLAYKLANSKKKGSVHIDLPKCVANDTFNNNPSSNIGKFISSFDNKIYNNKYKTINDKSNIYKISKIINSSESPILYVGQVLMDYLIK